MFRYERLTQNGAKHDETNTSVSIWLSFFCIHPSTCMQIINPEASYWGRFDHCTSSRACCLPQYAPIVHCVSPTSTTRFRAQTMLSGRSSFSWVAQSMSGCSCICINRSNQVSTLTSTDTVRQAMPVLGIFKLTRYLSLHKQHQAWWSLANNTISQAPRHCRQISSKIAANTSEDLRVAQYSNCM